MIFFDQFVNGLFGRCFSGVDFGADFFAAVGGYLNVFFLKIGIFQGFE